LERRITGGLRSPVIHLDCCALKATACFHKWKPILNKIVTGKYSISLGEISEFIKAEIKGDAALRISGIASLEGASPDQLSFLVDSRYEHLVSNCRAGALIVTPAFRELDFNLLITDNPYLALARAAQLFPTASSEDFGIHPASFLGENIRFGELVSIGPFAHVGDNCVIGAGTKIGSGAHLGDNIVVGDNCLIHPRVSILAGCVLGNRVIVHSGAVIGADGFGYAQDEQGRHIKIPQTGVVQIDDDVEIGANATIDRATFGKTWIKRGTKIDNLVMIAHNVIVGEDCAIVAQVGISGSTHLGDHVVLGGQVGIAGHIEIGDRVKIGAKSGILHAIKPDQIIMGIPGVPRDEWFRTYSNVLRLPRLKAEIKRLVERVQSIEEELKRDDGHTTD
jgi:UDP-3-O-[3-hydroxymyristoyl] glucosamine N-acyltransferase